MKYRIVSSLVLLITSVAIVVSAYKNTYSYHITDLEHTILTAHGTYSEPLYALIERTGLVVDGTLEDLVAKSQVAQPDGGWLRQPNSERWELVHDHAVDTTWYIDNFKKIGFVQEIQPLHKKYTYALILGATMQGMRMRLKHLFTLIEQQGISIGHIVFLVGQRPRDAKRESAEILFDQAYSEIPFDASWVVPTIIPETETEMAYLIVAQSRMPEVLKSKISIVDTPMIVKDDGRLVRPTTDDTVRTWLAIQPEPGPVLCLSSQPYVLRQFYVVKRLLSHGWDIDCVGRSANIDNINVLSFLDELARTLWELKKLA